MTSRPGGCAITGAAVLYVIAFATCGIGWELGMPWLWAVTAFAGIWASVLLTVRDIPVIVMEDYSGDDLMALADAVRERTWPALPQQWTAEDWAELEREVKGPTP